MLAAIKHGLINLFNFQGRDARQAFWFYVLFVYLITMAISMAVSMPMTMQTMMIGVQQGMANARNPDQAASEATMHAAIAASIGKFMPLLLWAGIASATILLVGLAASFVRRLHDSNLSGWWALIPGALQAFNLAILPGQFSNVEKMMNASMSGDPTASFVAMQGSFSAGAVAGWAAIIAVIIFGVRKSTDGANRYGDAPFTA